MEAHSKLARWCFSLAEFDFSIEHHPGKDNVVTDALSRAPLPTSHPEVNIIIIPPSQVSSFLITALGVDVCLQITGAELRPLCNPLACINLACSTQNPLTAKTLPSSLYKQTLNTPYFATAVDIPAADANHTLEQDLLSPRRGVTILNNCVH